MGREDRVARLTRERDDAASNYRYWKARCESHGRKLAELQAEIDRLKTCTHCYEPSCWNYNGPSGWDRREQYS